VILARQPDELSDFLDNARRHGKSVGLHPTMGALHGGHRANISKMAAECDASAVTIYVNRLQFGTGEDFASYPRDLDADVALAEDAGADLVFAPAPGALFPEEPLARVSVARLSEMFEGEHRPGHFGGVATIVTKLLALAGPCWAYFGEKDYQQLVLVRRMVADLSLPAVVVPCPTVRETDGLALSSRNAYLSLREREAAPCLYWSLLAGKRAIEELGERSAAKVRGSMLEAAKREKLLDLDYAAVVDPSSLQPVGTVSGEVRLLVAGRIGKTRLIDNVAARTEK
jgi:pantoate--beta-alanine ligase